MSERCAHEGWGRYSGEVGNCPAPADLVAIEGGVECPVCGFHVRTLTGANALNQVFAVNRETATIDRETR